MGKSGKNNPDDVLIGMMDSPEIKALIEFVAEADGERTVSDWIRSQIFARATANGILKDMKATPEWKDRIIARAAVIREAKIASREARKSSRKQKIGLEDKNEK